MPRGPQQRQSIFNARRIKNKLSQISLFECGAPACRGCTRTSVCPGRRALDWNSGRDERMPWRRLKATHWRFVKANLRLHKSVGWAFASPSIFNKTWKVTEFYEPSKQPLRRCSFFYGRTDEHAFFSFLFFFYPLTVPLPVSLKVLDFSSAEKEQARTGKMNDINGQPILPGTCDWDKWALLH